MSCYWNVFGFWIAFLRLVPGLRWIVWRLLFEPVARRAPWRLELYEAILQRERYKRNNRPYANRFSPTLTIGKTPGLSAVTEMAAITPTASREDMRRKIEKMSSGCIGVSGLRGSGKSTLIRDFCSHRYGTPKRSASDFTELPGLRLMVQAPLRYDAREFLIYQYTCLCKAVLTDVRLNPTSFVHHIVLPLLLPRSIRPGTLLRGLSGIALLAAAGILAYRAAVSRWPVPSWPPRTWELLGAVTAVVAAMAVFGWRTRQALIEVRQIVTLAADAQSRLEQLHFQRTDTRSRGGTLSGPMGTGLNLTSTRAFVEQMMTLPELIDDYRDFAERVVAALQQTVGSDRHKTDLRLVIGIDEMDQIEDAQGADRFLKELSSVFGIPHCVYLISVSPDTLAATDQRMVPLKTSSGGLFDEMVWIEPLDLPQASDLLDHRVIGLPAAFIALCYVLSGGLPRDLLRVARAIFTTGGDSANVGLAKATHNVIKDEIRALKHRAMAHASSLDIPATPNLVGLLSADDWPFGPTDHAPQQLANIGNILGDLSQLWAGKARERFAGPDKAVAPLTAEICDSFLAGLYLLLTVYQIFTAEPARGIRLAICPAEDGTSKFEDHPVLRDLARARTTLGVNPYLASAIICDARETLSRDTGHPGFAAGIAPHFLNHPPAHHTQPAHCPPNSAITTAEIT